MAKITGGEKQSNRDAIERMTERLVRGNSDGSGRMSPEKARQIARDAAIRCERGKVKHK